MRKRQEKNIIILYPEGNVDIDSADFIEETGGLLADGHSKLLFNFNNVDMVDYNGLSVITIAYKNIINKGGQMKFCNVPVHIKELFKLVRLDLVFDIYVNEQEAIRSFEISTKIDKLYLRRRFKRLESQLAIRYSLSSAVKKAKMLTGKILNISGEGIFIYSRQSFPVSTELELEIKLDPARAPFKLQGMVIWQADKELQPHCYPGMGVQFLNLDSFMQMKIIDFIDKNITHRSKI